MNLRVLVDIGHPAHVHLFKHVIWKLQSLGATTYITTRDKDVAIGLLDEYGFSYQVIGKHPTLFEKVISMATVTRRLLKVARSFNPHILIASGSVHAGPVAQILNRIYLSLTDTESSVFQRSLYLPFADRVYTPSAFTVDIGSKQVRYNGFHEMSYLSPDYFKPDPEVLRKYGMDKGEQFFLIRKVNMSATHDMGQKGLEDLHAIVRYLERQGQVFIVSETGLDDDLMQYRAPFLPSELHSVLSESRLFIGESGTMTSESISLGVPAIYVCTQLCGTTRKQVESGLVYFVYPTSAALRKVKKAIDAILSFPPEYFREKNRQFISNRVDLAGFLVDEMTRLAKIKYG